MSRLLAYGFGLSVVALVGAKGFDDPADDSYPLSTFPMFARARDKPWLNFAEGVDAAQRPVRLTPELVASGEVMQAAATVRRAVAAGAAGMAPLCASIAERAAQGVPEQRLIAIRIVAARFDPVRYFVDGPVPEERSVLWQCPVASTP